jgi:isochorismate synthase EntC
LEWLQQQTGSSKFYWRDRGDEFEMASLGYVDRYSLPEGADYEEMFSYLQNRLNPEYKNLRYYGGISFQLIKVDPHPLSNPVVVFPQELHCEYNDPYVHTDVLG